MKFGILCVLTSIAVSGCVAETGDLSAAESARETAEARVAELEKQVADLEAQIAELEAESTTTTTTSSTTTTTLAPRSFDEDDFFVTLTVVESKCFNTAGASVTIEPQLDVFDLSEFLSSGLELTIVYEVRGGENVNIYNVNLQSDGTYTFDQELIHTESCDYELSAVVVNVIDR